MYFLKWKLKLCQDGQNGERKVELSRASSPIYWKEALIAGPDCTAQAEGKHFCEYVL